MTTRHHHRPIVVGVDRSDYSLAAVDLGVAEARARRAPLVLLSAHPVDDRTGPRTALTALLRRICVSWPGLPATAHNVTGDPVGTLIDASRTASLLVVGRRPAGRDDAGGTIAAQVAAHSMCPTVVAPADAPGLSGGPVVLGLALSAEDDPATGFAFEEAARRRVPLRAVHVWSGIPSIAIGDISPFSYDLGRAQDAADQMLADALAPWVEKYPGVTVEQMALYDVDPAQTLADASGLAGLMVVGSHRQSLHGSQPVGTVTRTLIRRADCPVAVVRPSHRN